MFWKRSMRSDMLSWLLLSSFPFFRATSVLSRLVNVTVDDQFGDPTTGLFPDYSPNDGTWHIGSRSEDCPSCFINPSVLNLTQVYNQTWHDATSSPSAPPPTITVRFNGSAVYVFNILVNTLSAGTDSTFVNISFSIDGEDVGVFTHSPSPEPGAPSILYNQLVYNNATLNDGPHILVMTAGNDSLILFDYFIYTTQSTGNDPISESSPTAPTATGTPPSSSSHSSESSTHSAVPIGRIIGGVLGGIAFLGVAIGAFFFSRRRARSGAAAATGTQEDKHRENGGGGVGREYGVRQGVRADPHASPSPLPSLSTAMPQSTSLDEATTQTQSLFLSHDASGPGTTHLSDASAVTDVQQTMSSPGSTSTTGWSEPKRRAEELTQRLETLQRSRSALSESSDRDSQSASLRSQSEARGASGTDAAIRGLEAEIGRLRGVLSTLNERLGDRGDSGVVEPLPRYAE
ncbi:hypothetical protein GSI_11122 [Ganoderma sinense ZZ0214-1]|uniref:Transporter n=1 Tax=Ganoderma sinense ZZ0214-1 TaxID=1077348 RepID=A0A2G8RZ36_9APHY|nr:hypothetical protein GSI_11122 [Ganoderma sinense ZZ0214-1]